MYYSLLPKLRNIKAVLENLKHNMYIHVFQQIRQYFQHMFSAQITQRETETKRQKKRERQRARESKIGRQTEKVHMQVQRQTYVENKEEN